MARRKSIEKLGEKASLLKVSSCCRCSCCGEEEEEDRSSFVSAAEGRLGS
jgi:hypothetical protein